MVYKIDYVDGNVLRWSVTESGVECEVDESYTPPIHVSVHDDGDFSTARAALRDHPALVRVATVEERVSFRHDPEQVLQVDVVDLKAVNSVARMVSKWGSPGEYRCYNVDFSREFRYCLEEGIDPLPNHELSQMQIAVSETELASERVTELTIDDETVTGSGADVLATLSGRVESVDPDVLFLNTSDLIPILFQQADRLDVEFQLGRRPGWQQLAGKINLRKLRTSRALTSTLQSPWSGDHRWVKYIHVESDEFGWLFVSRGAIGETTARVGVVVDREYSNWDSDSGSTGARCPCPVAVVASREVQNDAPAARRRPRWVHLCAGRRPTRGRSRTRLLLVVSEYHRHAERESREDPL